MHLHSIYVGHWAGNLGDSAVFDVFDQNLPDNVRFTIEVDSIGDWRRRPQTVLVHWQDETAIEREMSACDAVVLVGTTVVTDLHDGEWPIAWIVKSLETAKRFSKSVHAVGVGIYPTAEEAEGQRFRKSFAERIDSFSVRDEASKRSLLSAGIPESRVLLAGDLAWLFDRPLVLEAAQHELDSFTNPENLIGVNVVHEDWEGEDAFYESLGAELDEVYFQTGARTIFFCNEIRSSNFFDRAAAYRTIDLMKSPAAVHPVRWMHPEEMIARLAFCKVVVSMRYHFSIFATLAKTPWIGFSRGQKSLSLLSEFGKSVEFTMGKITKGRLCKEIFSAFENRDRIIKEQSQVSKQLKQRAEVSLRHLKNILL
jgi:polysaccharide pyruvyl transferase WcaK-like protein